MDGEWRNWSGSLRFAPAEIAEPRAEAELATLVRRAADDRRIIRVVGAGHSSAPLVQTADVLVSLKHFTGIHEHDRDKCEAVVGAGMTIHDIGAALFDHGLALHNTGDVDVQTLAGAVATGTHGTGRKLGNLATPLIGGRLLDGTGAVREIAIESDADVMRALRVSLGAVGILTRLRLRLQPAFQLRRREWCTHIDDCMRNLDALIDGNRNFDFYWYPRSDRAKLRTMNVAGEDRGDVPWASCVRDDTGWSHAGPACFQEVRRRVKDRWRHMVGWRVLYRTIAADDAYLSPMHGRESVAISLHQNVGLPFDEYFADIEPVFRAHGGRPHWGKKHNLSASALAPLYPAWSRYHDIRQRHDPHGVFLSDYVRTLLLESDA